MKQKFIDTRSFYVIRNILLIVLLAIYVYSVSPAHIMAKVGAVIMLGVIVYSVTERLLHVRFRTLCAIGIAGLMFLQLISMLSLFHVSVWLGIIACLALLTKQS